MAQPQPRAAANPHLTPQSDPDTNSDLSILDTFDGQGVLLTGATGFVGKCVLEKLVRCVPGVRRVFVLVRPRRGATAAQRLASEVLGSPCFSRCRDEFGAARFAQLAADKVVAVGGDLTQQRLGLSAEDEERLRREVNIVIHCAAVVDFNERLDRALELNLRGSERMMHLAKSCERLRCFVHVSTCYVNSNKHNGRHACWLGEKLYPLGFDLDDMLATIDSMDVPSLEPVGLAALLGDWANTYTFTKAMTEHLLVRDRGNMPLVILRPSMIGAAMAEPMPGWVDVISAAGSVYLAIGMGVLKFMPEMFPDSIGDLVPVDYVINATLAAVAANADRDDVLVCHSASSSENPATWGLQQKIICDYFQDCRPSKAISGASWTWLVTPQMYQIHFFLRYSIPSALVNSLAVITGSEKHKQLASRASKLVWKTRVLIETLKYFTMHQWIFDNRNTRALGRALRSDEASTFQLDMSYIDWPDYVRSYLYGIMRFILKEDTVPLATRADGSRDVYMDVCNSGGAPATPISGPGMPSPANPLQAAGPHVGTGYDAGASKSRLCHYMPDMSWALERTSDRPKYAQARTAKENMMRVLRDQRVVDAMRDAVEELLAAPEHERQQEFQAVLQSKKKGKAKSAASDSGVAARMTGESNELGLARRVIHERTTRIMTKMFGTHSMPVIGSLGYMFRKIWRRMFKGVHVQSEGLRKVQRAARDGPLIFIPTHRSYLDFLALSYVCFATGLPMPHIAAGEDFLGIAGVRWLFRHCGAFFIRRSFSDDPLYSAIFAAYVRRLLSDGQSVEFFIEGTRSRSGKMLHPKLGMLSVITDAILRGDLPQNATIVPLALNYERTVESNLYSNELMGQRKIRESLRALLRSASVVATNFGRVSIAFAEPLRVQDYMQQLIAARSAPDFFRVPMLLDGFAADPSSPALDSTFREAHAAASGTPAFDPLGNKADRAELNRRLGYEITYRMNDAICPSPSHLVAALMLMYRQGIARSQLASQVDWLREEISVRGGNVLGMDGRTRERVVEDAVKYLGPLVLHDRQDVYEPAIVTRSEYNNMLGLGHYRNRILHYFFLEGIVACALYSFHDDMDHHLGVDEPALLKESHFLYGLLHLESIVHSRLPEEGVDLRSVLSVMVDRGILHRRDNGRLEVAPSGEAMFSFLCSITLPIIDSYYVATLILFSLQPDRSVGRTTLTKKTQWLATTLYHESMICFFESCSKDTLNNAFALFRKWRIIDVKKSSGKRGEPQVSLVPPFHEEQALTALLARINKLRRPPPVKKNPPSGTRGLHRSLIADVPILARL